MFFLSNIANITFSVLDRIEKSTTKEEIKFAKEYFKRKMIEEKKNGANIGSFVKAAVVCGDYKVLRLFQETFPKSFEKVANSYINTSNKEITRLFAKVSA